MMNIDDIKSIFFIGIGGIGMSALARFFNHKGVKVSGYDKTATPLSRKLEAEGIAVHYFDDVSLLDKSAQLVVYTPAIPATQSQLKWYQARDYKIVKRSDVLGMITQTGFNICVAGTHGKTSISTMVAHLLRHTGYGCNAFLGGVSVNYGTNFWSSANQVSVIEADEFDRSFLKLSPDISVVTSMDPDHLDIYKTADAMQQAFVDFASKTKPTGVLIRRQELVRLNEAMVRRQLTYQLEGAMENIVSKEHEHHDEEDEPDIYAENIEVQGNGYRFDAMVSGVAFKGVQLNTGGLHNIENMLVAITVAKLLDIKVVAIKEAVAAYKGVKRRFEYILDGSTGTPVFIDDYAHHPSELEALLKSVRNMYPGKKVAVIFQPHLFSRTKDFADGFATSLMLADEAVLLPVYPARELPMEGVTSELIGNKMERVTLLEKNLLNEWLQLHPVDVLVTAGAGDIDAMIPEIKEILQKSRN
jgi:UDP-N-acetylmuramate--alanine ligase